MFEKEKEWTEFNVPPIQPETNFNPVVMVDEAAAPLAWYRRFNWRFACGLFTAWIVVSGGAHLLVKVVSSLSYNPALAELVTLTEKGGLFPIPIAQKAVYDPQPGGAGFSGPGDVQGSAVAFWSCSRGYSAAYAAPGNNPACDLVDTATGLVTFTMNILTTGFADAAGAAASSACAVACSIKKAYDQTGHSLDASQATLSQMPTITFSALNGLPGATFLASSAQFLVTATAPNWVQPSSFSFVHKRTGSTAAKRVILGDTGGPYQLQHTNAANSGVTRYGGSNVNWGTGLLTENTFHVSQLLASGASSSFKIDSGSTTGISDPGTSTTSGTIRLGADSGGNQMEGVIMEWIVWNSDISGNWTNLNSNQHGANGYNF